MHASLASHFGYLVDPEARWELGRDGRSREADGVTFTAGTVNFGFQARAYWFWAFLLNNTEPEAGPDSLNSLSLLDDVKLYGVEQSWCSTAFRTSDHQPV